MMYDAPSTPFSFLACNSILELEGTVLTLHGDLLVVYGNEGSFQPTLACSVSGSIIAAESRSANTATCITPAIGSLPNLTVRIHLMVVSGRVAGEVTFKYTAPLRLESHGPLWGPVAGGTIITIVTKDLLDTRHWFGIRGRFCTFGALRVPLMQMRPIASIHTYQCSSPSVDRPQRVEVSLSSMPFRTKSEAIRFDYEASLQVWSLSPTQGTTQGGARVTINGEGFTRRANELDHLWCMFNFTTSRAVYISTSKTSCTSPRHGEGAVALEMTNNYQQFTTNRQMFLFCSPAAATIHPTSGPVNGGTTLVVYVPSMPDGKVHCSFDGTLTAATAHSRDHLVCETPLRTSSGIVRGSLVHGGYPMASLAAFSFYEEIRLMSILPLFGPNMGGTHITIHARPSVPSSVSWCCFDRLRNAFSRPTLPPAKSISPTTVVCVSPAAKATGPVAVSISVNAHDRSEAIPFEYTAPSRLVRISPMKGPLRGGTYILLLADTFWDRWSTQQPATCRFEQQQPATRIQVPATQVDSGWIACITSVGHVLGVASVEISLNGVDYSSDGQVFEFAQFEFTRVAPASGPIAGEPACPMVHGFAKP